MTTRQVSVGGSTPPPLVARRWDPNRMTVVTAAAMAPALGVAIHTQSGALVAALALGVALAWTWLFTHLRGRPLGWDWIAPGLSFAILIPDTVPIWQQLMALSFGVVMGEQIFGGRGRNFLHPTVVALAFLMFSFPGDYRQPQDMALTVAAGAGGLLLLGARILAWRVVAGILMGVAAAIVLSGAGGGGLPLSGIAVFAVLFLIGDPVAAASTNAGRWAYGLLAGMLTVILGEAGGDPGSLRAVIFAALLAGIFAPLIDQIVIWTNVRRRRRRG